MARSPPAGESVSSGTSGTHSDEKLRVSRDFRLSSYISIESNRWKKNSNVMTEISTLVTPVKFASRSSVITLGVAGVTLSAGNLLISS